MAINLSNIKRSARSGGALLIGSTRTSQLRAHVRVITVWVALAALSTTLTEASDKGLEGWSVLSHLTTKVRALAQQHLFQFSLLYIIVNYCNLF